MAVVIQRMIPCEAAGAAFSLDPVSGDAGRILIDANHGLGESVVSGESAVDHWVLDRERLEILEAKIADKALQTIGDDEGIRHVTLTGDQARQPCLSESQLRSVARGSHHGERRAAVAWRRDCAGAWHPGCDVGARLPFAPAARQPRKGGWLARLGDGEVAQL